MHRPVLEQQAIDALEVKKGGRYIDGTAGEGGHLSHIRELGGIVLGIDWDEAQIANLKSKFTEQENLRFAVGNFADIAEIARANGFEQVDGVILDFGLSMHQLSTSGRGLSFKNDNEPLDMRLNAQTEDTAADLIRRSSETELYEIFAGNSEEFHSKQIAQAISQMRPYGRIEMVGQLKAAVIKGLEACSLKHDHDAFKIYPRIFQALRIAVNHEFDNIRRGIEGSLQVCVPGGRIVIITFHSLEDRVVKSYIRQHGLTTGIRKAVKGDQTLKFERSAKMRVIIA